MLTFLVGSGCQPQTLKAAVVLTTTTPQPSITPAIPTNTSLSPTLPPSPTITLTPTPAPGPRICSPLAEQPLHQLTQLVANPYHPPAPGSDDPHQGVDLAIMYPGTRMAAAGNPVQAALAGQVAAVIQDRFPYGNAIIIETPLENFSSDWWAPAEIPTPAPTLEPRSALTCPPALPLIIPNPAKRSLYLLYGHMQQSPTIKVGDPVSCGQVIDAVGSTGNALNPHLHFEARVGPAGLRFTSLAHYDASATPEEMSNYCLWRVSGLFQLVDPNKLLELTP